MRRVHSPTYPSSQSISSSRRCTRGRSRRPYHPPAISAPTGTLTFTYPSKPSISSQEILRCARGRLRPAAAPAAGRDGMTPSACRGPGESCRYRDMLPRSRRSAAVGRSRVPRRPRPAMGRLAGYGAIGRQGANRHHSLLPTPRGHGGIYTRREGRVNM